jgi:hypothetical protein
VEGSDDEHFAQQNEGQEQVQGELLHWTKGRRTRLR